VHAGFVLFVLRLPSLGPSLGPGLGPPDSLLHATGTSPENYSISDMYALSAPFMYQRTNPPGGIVSSTAITVVARRRRTSAWSRVVIAALAMLLAMFVAGLARPAAAHAWEPDVNGCGAASGISHYVVPNAPLGYDFTSSCNSHDYCYGVGLDKSFCDSQFLNNMQAVCQGGFVCNGLANLYYFAVDKAGQGPYEQSAQDRLDKLVNDLVACNSDDNCESNAAHSWDLDSLINDIVACQDDAACEHQVALEFPDIDPGPLDSGSGLPEDQMPPDNCDWGLDIQAAEDAGC
jgi:hypothetical protein